MSERVFRITSLFVVIMLVFAFKVQAEDLSEPVESPAKTVTEMQKAMHLAEEIQALNRGDFDSHSGPYHPNRQLLLDGSTLSLSVKRK